MKTNRLLVAMLCCVLAACSAEYSGVYQSVDAESKWDESTRILINESAEELPPFREENNRLYLMIQENRVDWYFHKVVSYPGWDSVEVSALLEQYPDIKSLFPVDWNNWLPKGYGDECKGAAQASAK